MELEKLVCQMDRRILVSGRMVRIMVVDGRFGRQDLFMKAHSGMEFEKVKGFSSGRMGVTTVDSSLEINSMEKVRFYFYFKDFRSELINCLTFRNISMGEWEDVRRRMERRQNGREGERCVGIRIRVRRRVQE